MKSIYLFVIFILLAVIQLFIPTKMILNQEAILRSGTAYKFKTQPIDPNDPFKGKYINLNYEIDSFKTKDSIWETNEPIYVYLSNDSLGFAKIDTISRTILIDNKNDYFKAKADWYSKYNHTLNIEFPFKRYYMEETKAYDAEVITNTRRDTIINTTYALVYIKDGDTVLEDVLVDDISIKDYVEMED